MNIYQLKKQLEISPLPAKDFVWIKIENASENMHLKLFNQFGVCVYSDKNISYNTLRNVYKLSVGEYAQGTYIIHLLGEKTSLAEKLIIQQ